MAHRISLGLLISTALMTSGAIAQGQISAPASTSQTDASTDRIQKFLDTLSDDEKGRLRTLLHSKTKARAATSESQKSTSAKPVQLSKKAAASPPPVADKLPECATQSFFVRRDRSELFSILSPCGPADVPGATVGYTDNRLTDAQTFNAQGWLAFAFKRDAEYAFGASLYLNGTWATPFKATERSAVRAALELQRAVSLPDFIFPSQDFALSPYVQTDFRGRARIAGINALWEPYNPGAHLGGRDDTNARKWIGFYWRLQGEIDAFRVEEAGLTNFKSNTSYALVGGRVQGRAILFQNMPEVGPLCGRIFANATLESFWDAESSTTISNRIAEVGYYLSSGVAPYWRFCEPTTNGLAPVPTSSATSSSVSFIYSNGTDKSTFQRQEQYRVQLNYRY
ncbi:MAG TPA: hypothetical protein VFB68_00815 [Xanthobacteraceae bacterium]|nr:hypothetical protein [Xanthobacteraceae bacterium]